MKKVIIILVCLFITSTLLAENTLIDVSNGVVDKGYHPEIQKLINLPEFFDVNVANAELKKARMNGDIERANELSQMIHTWWKLNRDLSISPMTHGSNPNPGPEWRYESQNPVDDKSSKWLDDVRIDPRDGIFDVKIASLSNGDLYAFAIYRDGADDHKLVRRSTDNGATWTTYDDYNYGTSTDISSPSIYVSTGDTILLAWILESNSTGDMECWVQAVLPGPSYNPVYWGTPTGMKSAVISDLNVITDYPRFYTAYVYATWTESYYTGTDSTKIMFARSSEHDVSSWEVGPTVISESSGENIYFSGTRIAYGYGMAWLIAWLHPFDYPTTYDRSVWGWRSTNYGSSWSVEKHITPYDNHIDEFDPSIAGSYINRNWVILATQVDTNFVNDQDVNLWYTTNDTIWNFSYWVSNSFENYLGDVWVDYGSNGFWGAFRQDRSGEGEEHVRYKGAADINNPASWTQSVRINDDSTTNLSGVYGSSVTYNEGYGEPCIAWTSYEGAYYSIWFDSYSGAGVSEEEISEGFIELAPNPSNGMANLSYSISKAGIVKISIYDISGRLIRNLIDETRVAGNYTLDINSRNLSSGIYFLHIITPDGKFTKSMTVVK
jgi:hypothetical protein